MNQMRRYSGAKIKFFSIFLTALLKTSYEYRESRIEDFFRPNAQVRLIKGSVFFSNRQQAEINSQ